jgi:hypothetical protein
MSTTIKHLTPLLLFIGAVTTPTFAFDVGLASQTAALERSDYTTSSSFAHSPELLKIADHVRSWKAPPAEAARDYEVTHTTSPDEAVEEEAGPDGDQEIKKLDNVLSAYVMTKYIKRIRRS